MECMLGPSSTCVPEQAPRKRREKTWAQDRRVEGAPGAPAPADVRGGLIFGISRAVRRLL
jgi:hypothetical protein